MASDELVAVVGNMPEKSVVDVLGYFRLQKQNVESRINDDEPFVGDALRAYVERYDDIIKELEEVFGVDAA